VDQSNYSFLDIYLEAATMYSESSTRACRSLLLDPLGSGKAKLDAGRGGDKVFIGKSCFGGSKLVEL
jgi:hypothetical protein